MELGQVYIELKTRLVGVRTRLGGVKTRLVGVRTILGGIKTRLEAELILLSLEDL